VDVVSGMGVYRGRKVGQESQVFFCDGAMGSLTPIFAMTPIRKWATAKAEYKGSFAALQDDDVKRCCALG
jgi:hypothetical protein